MEALGTILGVWAHPDDENYLSGGIMATAVDLGSRVVCATATKGEEVPGITSAIRPPGWARSGQKSFDCASRSSA